MYDLVIIGGGAAGMSAAIYAMRGGMKTLLLEKLAPGGQAAKTYEVDNYPGFPEGIDGFTLGYNMQKGAERFGCVTLQTEVHKKKAPLLTKLLDKMNRKISQADIDHATKYDLHTILEGMHKHDKVLHGDFNPSNIIMSPNGQAYILDWAHATQGNASADAARTYLVFNLAGKAALADKYLELFCAKSGINKRYVQRWLPVVAASQSVKAIPEEKEFLSKWINVFDYE